MENLSVRFSLREIFMKLIVEKKSCDVKNWNGLYEWLLGNIGEKWPSRVFEEIEKRKNKYKSRKDIFKSEELFKQSLWSSLVMGLVSSQQKMDDDSPARNLIAVCEVKTPEGFAGMSESEFLKIGGDKIRMKSKVFDKLHRAAEKIKNLGVGRLMNDLKDLADEEVNCEVRLGVERRCADLLREEFFGIGLKQSRNVLLYMGLTRFVVPLDSRVLNSLNKMGLETKLGASAFQDKEIYLLFEDLIFSLCREMKAGILPYEFDALCFVGYESVLEYCRLPKLEMKEKG